MAVVLATVKNLESLYEHHKTVKTRKLLVITGAFVAKNKQY